MVGRGLRWRAAVLEAVRSTATVKSASGGACAASGLCSEGVAGHCLAAVLLWSGPDPSSRRRCGGEYHAGPPE